jgi:hypothetical protein
MESQIIGKCLAGHPARIQKMQKEREYDNPLTDMVNLLIAENKVKMEKQGGHNEPDERRD